MTAGKYIYIFISCILLCASVKAQKVYYNTDNKVYELSVFNCSVNDRSSLCSFISVNVFSMAMYYDTLYCVDQPGRIYKIDVTNPGTCQYIGNIPSAYNSMTVNKNGVLYFARGGFQGLWKFDTRTNVSAPVGNLNINPEGDMIFYKGKLLITTSESIYEIDTLNTATAIFYMHIGYPLRGLVSFPVSCTENKTYGTTTSSQQLVELDLDNRTVVGPVCNMPSVALDAACAGESGQTVGVTLDSVHIVNGCNYYAPTRDIQVFASSGTSGAITYQLDNTPVNTTGIFNNVSVGIHRLRASNRIGCLLDSMIEIKSGLSPVLNINITNSASCDLNNGSITVTGTSGFPPILYRLNNGPFAANSTFSNLPAGTYLVTAKDSLGCTKDSLVRVNNAVAPDFITSITATNAYCNEFNGKILIRIQGSVNTITTSLNGSIPFPTLDYPGLDSGNYQLTIFRGACRFDTLLRINRIILPRPAYTLTVQNQLCSGATGRITLAFATPGYLINFNNSPYSDKTDYSNLLPGNYRILIKDTAKGCVWDTSVTITPYIIAPLSKSVATENIDCRYPQSGYIIAQVGGAQQPYSITYNSRRFASGSTISPVRPGLNKLTVYNADDCIVDSFSVNVNASYYPECNQVQTPTIFTPNGDGINDKFLPVTGYYIEQYSLKVFNRFGQMVFQSENLRQGWDGTYKNTRQPTGAYIYTLRYTSNGKAMQLKGTIVLTR